MKFIERSRVSFGRPIYIVSGLFRVDVRSLLVGTGLMVAVFAIATVSLASGRYPIAVADMIEILAGHGDDNMRMILLEWRMPRIGLAILLGAALGMSGAIFQSITRNPLGSPDIIGFSAGSHTGALVVMLLLSGGYYETAAGALAGGIAAAMAVYMLAYRHGIQGFRLIVVGIGVAAVLSAFNAWMIRGAELQIAMSAAIWGAGSLNGLGIDQLVPVAAMLCLIAPAILVLSRPMRQLELGDDAARASGVDANMTRLLLMVLGVALIATVTAVAGPISFIALCAPQIAKRLVPPYGTALLPSAMTGALLLLAADWAAQHAFATQLPVGVMTSALGGVYFLWLLVRERRL